jgi:hypothetical protein
VLSRQTTVSDENREHPQGLERLYDYLKTSTCFKKKAGKESAPLPLRMGKRILSSGRFGNNKNAKAHSMIRMRSDTHHSRFP